MSDQTRKQKRTRSPRYPAFGLPKAVKHAQVFYETEGLHAVPDSVAAQDWGYSPTSSTGKRSVAALLHFDLLEEAEDSGGDRLLTLSELGQTIVLDEREDSPPKRSALRQAALRPKVYRDLWKKYGPSLPSFEAVKLYLVRDLGFNPNSVSSLVDDYQATIEFAGLDDEHSYEDDEDDGKNDGGAQRPERHAGSHQEGIDPRMPGTRGKRSQPWDLTIPLMDGEQAVLRVPRPLSEENFNHLKKFLDTVLPLQKRALTSGHRGSQPESAEAEDK